MAGLLGLHWDYPVYQATVEPKPDVTAPRVARTALSRAQALRVIAGGDPRPLIVLRECARCNKTDDALLTPGYDNEKVLFLTRWFHCVKLPVDVVQSDHPFNALFPNNDAEHLFVSTVDGSVKDPLESDTSRVELCAAMTQVLSLAYSKDPSPLYKELHTLGDQLDILDAQVQTLRAKKAEMMEARISDKKRVAKLDAEIAAVKKEIADKLSGFDKASKIELRPVAAPGKPGH